MGDLLRPVATNSDKHVLTIKDVANDYSDAGHPRTIRTLQRYCESGHLDAIKMPTQLGDLYLITPESVARHIAQIEQVEAATRRATGRDEARLAAPAVVENNLDDEPTQPLATGSAQPRSAATPSRYVAQLEKENSFLHEQIVVKDTQIKDLTERARETNHLIAGLQHMLSPLLGTRHDERDPSRPAATSSQDAPPESMGDNA